MQAERLVRKNVKVGVLAAASLALLGGIAQANGPFTDLDFDLNAISVQAINSSSVPVAMSASHTGSLVIAYDADAELVDIAKDGSSQSFSGALQNLDGLVTLSNGNIVGGSLEFRMNNGDSYTTAIQPGGKVIHYPGVGSGLFALSPLTTSGDLSGATFAGVDVTPWSQSDLKGYLTLFFFPNGTGADDSASLQVTVQPVPEPASLMGLASCAGALLMRRRRSN